MLEILLHVNEVPAEFKLIHQLQMLAGQVAIMLLAVVHLAVVSFVVPGVHVSMYCRTPSPSSVSNPSMREIAPEDEVAALWDGHCCGRSADVDFPVVLQWHNEAEGEEFIFQGRSVAIRLFLCVTISVAWLGHWVNAAHTLLMPTEKEGHLSWS